MKFDTSDASGNTNPTIQLITWVLDKIKSNRSHSIKGSMQVDPDRIVFLFVTSLYCELTVHTRLATRSNNALLRLNFGLSMPNSVPVILVS